MKKLDLEKIGKQIEELKNDPIKNYHQLLNIYFKLYIYDSYLKK